MAGPEPAPERPASPGNSVVLATFNLHGGVDGWGRPFELVEACRSLEADVLVLQESWSRQAEPGLAEAVGEALGYEVTTLAMGRCLVFPPPPDAPDRWGPRRRRRRGVGVGTRPSRRRGARQGQLGVVSLAVLSRLPVRRSAIVELGRLRRDRVRRGAVMVELDVGDGGLTVVGTHMSHLLQGSPRQLARLRDELANVGGPVVLAGDMNLWAPVVARFFPGWRAAARGRTWPAPHPLFQIDHILVRGALSVHDGGPRRVGGSDHFPLRAELSVP